MPVLAQFDVAGSLEPVFTNVMNFVPRFLGFLAILIIGYIVAKLIAKAVNGILERVGFDRAVERGGVRKALARSKYDPSDILAKIAFYAVFLFVLQMAFGVFGDNPISDLLYAVIAFLPNIFSAIIIVVVAAAIAAAVREVVVATLGGLSYGNTLANIAGGAILVVGSFMALSQLEIAEPILNGLFYALLAIVVGSAVIAIGGGGVRPMQRKWEEALQRYDEERDRVKEEVDSTSSEDLKARAEQRKAEVSAEAEGGGASRTIQLPEDADTRR
jgi:hypothetical protein